MLSERFDLLSRLIELTDKELDLTYEVLREAASKLIHHYSDDLEHKLESEIVHFAALSKGLENAHVFDVTSSFETHIFLQLNENDSNKAFPSVNIVLNICLCMFVSNCKGERWFSKLKLITKLLKKSSGTVKAIFFSSSWNRE